MQVVIDISKQDYKEILRTEVWNDYEKRTIRLAIKNGTVLPKNHGRLGDLDALEEEMIGGINAGLMIDGYEDYTNINDTEDCLECVKYADTIIKAHHPVPVKKKSKDRDDDRER